MSLNIINPMFLTIIAYLSAGSLVLIYGEQVKAVLSVLNKYDALRFTAVLGAFSWLINQ